ncbi:hypothetical protein GE09DRAFT_727001 [Coniochaeta sp. 2T2.1]|nr:hypothetical protein GE09DRAFT_727001 [Coniochaeta sp. 2T2.1]
MSSAGKPTWCAYCGQKFTRKEHLERHIPTHTNIKPFICEECGLDFNRRDLLTRHVTQLHEKRSPGDSTASGVAPMIGKLSIACVACADAKTGCDKAQPSCGRCKEKRIPCTQRLPRRSAKLVARSGAAADPRASTMPNQNPQGHNTVPLTGFRQQPHQPSGSPQPPQPPGQSLTLYLQGNHSVQSPDHFPSPGLAMGGLLQTIGPEFGEDCLPRQGLSGHAQQDFAGNGFFQAQDVFGSMEYAPAYQDAPPEFVNQYVDWNGDGFDLVGTSAHNGIVADADTYADTMSKSPSLGVFSTPSPQTGHTRATSINSCDHDLQQKPKPSAIRFHPVDSPSDIPEYEEVVKAEASWPLARCNKQVYSGQCPRTAVTHLKFLERSSRGDDTWKHLETYVCDHVNWQGEDLTAVKPLTSHNRDRVGAITQKFLHKALEIHGTSTGRDGYVVLPPSHIMEYFLKSYVRSLSVYYPLVASGRVDPNEMLSECRPSTLLFLLMMAQGAAAMPVDAARYLSTALTETCRISLFDIIEKNVKLSADPITLRCAFLFTLLGAWSGDKWLMDIAMGQRGMYMSMLKHAGMLDSQIYPPVDFTGNFKAQREAWIKRVFRNRLTANWVMVDHELSLFYDTTPLLAIDDLHCPLPAPEAVWATPDAASWAIAMRSMYPSSPPDLSLHGSLTDPPSLYELFRKFLRNSLAGHLLLTPQHLRLLLHPINAAVYRVRQMHACLPEKDEDMSMGRPPHINQGSTESTFREIQGLLRQWYDLTVAHGNNNTPCPLTRCNLVLYHLMFLNTVTDFPQVERLARQEYVGEMNTYPELVSRHKRCILSREQARLHSGQVLRLLRQMPPNRRPSWWTTAMYRAILILWADSMFQLESNFKSEQAGNVGNGTSTRMGSQSHRSPNSPYSHIVIPIDLAAQDDSALLACLSEGRGIPVLTSKTGTAVELDKPLDILEHGISTVSEGDSSRIGDGIRRKLTELRNRWQPFGVTGFNVFM